MKRQRIVLAALLVAGAVGVAGLGGWRWGTRALRQPGPLQAAGAVIVPRGSTDQLAKALAAHNVIAQSWLFDIAVWASWGEGPLHAAEFAFPAHASLRDVLAILRTGRPVQHQLTIAEGLTAQQIADTVAHAGAMTGAVPPIAEGSVLPETYDYDYDANRGRVLARASAAMDRTLAKDWAMRAPGLPFASPQEALILASIVERETADPKERPHIAAVYINRLRIGMRLQADPTVAYAASKGSGVLDHDLTRAELEDGSPYNTYRVAGLPPGPICSPGPESLRAVLHPADSADLYFVADGTGGHTFSRNYQAHDAAVARWRALGNSRP